MAVTDMPVLTHIHLCRCLQGIHLMCVHLTRTQGPNECKTALKKAVLSFTEYLPHAHLMIAYA